MQEYEAKVAAHYDAEAQVYDEGYSTPLNLAENWFVQKLLEPYIDGSICDVGCGTGLLLDLFPETSPENYYGVDVSEGMVHVSHQRHPEYAAVLTVGDMHDLSEIPDGSFDNVISLFGPISYSPDPQKVIAELRRIVKPGGYLILMPYTQRTVLGIDLGPFSTAATTNVEKWGYSSAQLKELFDSFDDVQILGINYFANTLERYAKELGKNIDETVYRDILAKDFAMWNGVLDVQFARHCMVVAKKHQKPYPTERRVSWAK